MPCLKAPLLIVLKWERFKDFNKFMLISLGDSMILQEKLDKKIFPKEGFSLLWLNIWKLL